MSMDEFRCLATRLDQQKQLARLTGLVRALEDRCCPPKFQS